MPSASPRPTRSLALVVALALLAAVPACSSSGDDGGGRSAAPTEPTGTDGTSETDGTDETDETDETDGTDGTDGTGDGSSIAGMLTLVPDTPGGREFVMVTRWEAVDAAVEGPAEESPEAADPVERELQRLDRLTGSAPTQGGAAAGTLTMPRQPDDVGALGFLPSDVRAEITVGQPPEVLSVAVGDLGAAAVLEAAEQVEGSTRSTREGLEVVRWLDDNEVELSLESPVGALPGGAGRVAAVDGLVAHATSDAVIDRLAEVTAGRGSSLAEVEPLRRAAEALDEAGVHSAALSDTPVRTQPRVDLDPDRLPEDQPTLGPYEAYGLGGTLTDEGPELVAVLVHADDDGAAENRRRLATVVEEGAIGDGRLWTDLLEDPRITQEGRTVVARFAVSSAVTWSQLVFRNDPLLAVG